MGGGIHARCLLLLLLSLMLVVQSGGILCRAAGWLGGAHGDYSCGAMANCGRTVSSMWTALGKVLG